MPQEDINALLVELGCAGQDGGAAQGRRPVRVRPRRRGGRGAARRPGCRSRWCPGVTAGVAAPAYAGIPVTHRDLASAVAFVTGHEDPGEGGERARLGRARPLPRHARALHGREEPAADRRAADRRRGARRRAGGGGRARHAAGPAQRRAGPLGEIAARVADAGPAGTRDHGDRARGRAARHARLARAAAAARPGGGRHPRAGAGERAGRAARRARRRGGGGAGDPDRAACGRAARRSAGYALVCFTSPNGVRAAARTPLRRADARALWRASTVAAIGPGTARELARRGIQRRRGAASARSRSRWSRRWRACRWRGSGVLVARAAEARDVLPDALRERGAEVDVLRAVRHRRRAARRRAARARSPAPPTSPSPPPPPCASSSRPSAACPDGARVVSIGPVTSATARELGLEVHVEAERHDIDGLVDALAGGRRDDRHPAHRLRPRRRLRRRLPRRDPRASRPTRRSWTSPTGSRATPCASGALVLRNTLPYMPVGVHVAVVDPQVGTERRALALRCEDGRMLVGPDNGLLSLAWERAAAWTWRST